MLQPSQLRTGAPSDVGMSADGLNRASALIASEVERGRITAAAILVARDSTIVLSEGFGRLSPGPEATPVTPDSVFLLASITKPFTACALMCLVDRGLISLNDPVSLHLPEFKGGERQKIRVRHLLSHTSGMPDMLPENIELRRARAPLSAFVERSLRTPLLYAPNTSFAYQSMGILLAGEIVEGITRMRLRDFKREEIFGPLGMRRSALGLGAFEIAETVWCGNTMAETEDARSFGPNTPYWRDMGHPWGGMHSTVGDLGIFLQTMLNNGAYDGSQIISPAAVKTMTTDQNRGMNAPWGLGWGLATSPVWDFFGETVSPATFGHTGSTGTIAWADPERRLLCVVLTNEMLEEGSLLRRVSNAVSAAVVSPV
jgi:CubicO group peptidase (beta-lactamase class C family)